MFAALVNVSAAEIVEESTGVLEVCVYSQGFGFTVNLTLNGITATGEVLSSLHIYNHSYILLTVLQSLILMTQAIMKCHSLLQLSQSKTVSM